jgi:serine/threonine protein kinase
MKKLDHPNIVKFYDLLISQSHYYVIMENCNCGSLSSCLRKYKNSYNKPFTQEIVQYLMRQIIEGMKYIHSLKIIHRDIKLDNILVTFSNDSDKNNINMLAAKIKIIDFGLAIELGPRDLTFTALGSPINMDPLILKKYNNAGGYEQLQGYNEKADIWSLGTVCYEMLIGEALYKVKDLKDLMKKVEKGIYSIPLNLNLSKEAVSFLISMLQYDGDDRLSASELAQHDFIVKNVNEFTKIDLNILRNKIDGDKLILNFKEKQTMLNKINNEDEKQELNFNKIYKEDIIQIPRRQVNIQNQNQNQHYYEYYNDYNDVNQYIQKKKSKHISPEGSRRITDQRYAFGYNNFYYNNNKNGYNINNNNYNYNYYDYNTYYYGHNYNYQAGQRINNKNNANMIYRPSNNIEIKKNEPFENTHRMTDGFVSPHKNKNKEIKKENESKENNKKDNIQKNNIKKVYMKKNSELNEKDKAEVTKYLNGLLEEYILAKQYFKKNELKNQEDDANQKIILIQNAKSQLEKENSLKSKNIPKPITPEYIYGTLTSERDKIFKEVIAKYTEEKKELETNLKNEILKLKKLEPELYAKMKSKAMPKLEKDRDRIEIMKKIIEGFEKNMKNKWVPAPKLSKDLEKCKNDKNSSDNNEYKLKIHLGKINYKKDNLTLKILLKINDNKTLEKEVKLKKDGDLNEEIIWTLNENEWKNIDSHLFALDYWTENMEENGPIKLNIDTIKEGKDLFFECPIDLHSQNIPIKVDINIHPIIPEKIKFRIR